MISGRSWDYRNPVHVVCGPGRIRELPQLVRGRSLLVTSAGMTRRGLTDRLIELLGPETAVYDGVVSNPTVDLCAAAVIAARRERFDTVVAVGGGSVIDVGKVVSLAAAAPQLNVPELMASDGQHDEIKPVPLIAIPTTAGTGSEVTPFATVWDAPARKKLSVSTPNLFAKIALVDPELGLSLAWDSTLGPGLDAYAQCFEAIWNHNATPVTTALARQGLGLVPSALRQLQNEPRSIKARSTMSEAALLSGMAISRTRTALAHSISYPLTAHLGLPHGLACALVLPGVLAFNLQVDDGRLAALAEDHRLESAEGLVRHLGDLLRKLGLADAVAAFVPEFSAVYPLVPEMLTPGRADNNMRAVTLDDVRDILHWTEAWLGGERTGHWAV